MLDYIIASLLLGASFAFGFFGVWHLLNTIKDIFKVYYTKKTLLNNLNNLSLRLDKIIAALQTEKESKEKKGKK